MRSFSLRRVALNSFKLGAPLCYGRVDKNSTPSWGPYVQLTMTWETPRRPRPQRNGKMPSEAHRIP